MVWSFSAGIPKVTACFQDDPLPNKKHKKEKKDKDNCSNLRLVHDLFHRLLCLVFVLCCLQDGAESKLKKDSKEKKDKDKKDKKEKKEKHKHGDDDEDFSSVRMLSTTALTHSQDMPRTILHEEKARRKAGDPYPSC